MRGLQALLATLVTTGLVAAGATAGGSVVKVPAPAIGHAAIELLTIRTGGTAVPRLKVTNVKQLGKGFGGVAVVGPAKKGKGVFLAYLVLYMGNLSTAPAGTIDLQLSTPASGTTVTNETDNCKVVTNLRDNNYSGLAYIGYQLAHQALWLGDSNETSFYDTTMRYLSGADNCGK